MRLTILLWMIATQVSLSHAALQTIALRNPDPNTYNFVLATGSFDDPTPNPCYRRENCDLRFFIIDRDWLPAGDAIYSTDRGSFDTPEWPGSYRTLGEYWKAARNRTRVGFVKSPVREVLKPCLVVGASDIDQPEWSVLRPGTIVSNCATAHIQAPSCSLSPETTNISIISSPSASGAVWDAPPLTLSCKTGGYVKIETAAGEAIRLSGSPTARAVLDWGAGFGRPSVVWVQPNSTVPIRLRVRTEGLETASAGVLSGSAIVSLSYD